MDLFELLCFESENHLEEKLNGNCMDSVRKSSWWQVTLFVYVFNAALHSHSHHLNQSITTNRLNDDDEHT